MKANNLVILDGRLGLDPEVKVLASGARVARLRLATTQIWRDKQQQRQERTDWHSVDAWEGVADFCGRYLRKGDRIQVVGALRNNVVEDEKGKRVYTTVRAWEVNSLGAGARRDAQTGEAPPPVPASAPAEALESLPF